MSQQAITMVRLYLAEGRDDVSNVIKWLGNNKVRGFTVFRGVVGQGADGQVHKASLLDLSSQLPIVIEFFDAPEQIDVLLEKLHVLVKPDHIVRWPATIGI